MYRRILVPLDGSHLAEAAMPYAQALAEPASGKLLLLRAAEAHWPYRHSGTAQGRTVELAETYLSSTSDRLQADGVPVETHIYYANAAQAIVEAVEALQVDLVALSTHGRTGVSRAVYGSVAEQVLARATAPVLLVSARNRRPWPAFGHPVVAALDGSLLAEKALPAAVDLARALRVPLRLLRIVEPVEPSYLGYVSDYLPADVRASIDAARAYLETVAARLPRVDAGISVHAALGDPHRTLVELAAKQRAASIVVATNGRTGVSRLVVGSVAVSAIRQAPMPVLVVRPPSASPPAEGNAGEQRHELADAGQAAALTGRA